MHYFLDEAGMEARHIMCVSGHRSETSIRSYASRLNDRKKRQISETLSKSTVLLPASEDTDTISEIAIH